MKQELVGIASSIAVLLMAAPAAAQDVLTGASAYGDWRSDAPGVMRHIRPGDMPPSDPRSSRANASRVGDRPQGASPKTMPGFTVETLATGLEGVRVLRVAPNGDVFASLSRNGRVVVIRQQSDGKAAVSDFAKGLDDPYGLAFYPPGPQPKWLYVAQPGSVVRYAYRNGDLKASGKAETVIARLPTGGHWTRDIAFSADGKVLYVAVGSDGNAGQDMGDRPADLAAHEKAHGVGAAWGEEEGRGTVLAYDPDGKNRRVYANGVRNCSGLALQPGTDTVYCATNERDMLGDDLPPDYISSVKEGGFYGWPWYYIGKNEDTRASGGRRPDLADKVIVPDVLVQAHSAPLGMAFNPGGQFPDEWKGDAFATLHGSWNRANRTGYKVVRLPFKDGKPTGQYQDFVTGFTAGDGSEVWGRPAGVTFAKDGSMLFSEDANGTVYRVTYRRP